MLQQQKNLFQKQLRLENCGWMSRRTTTHKIGLQPDVYISRDKKCWPKSKIVHALKFFHFEDNARKRVSVNCIAAISVHNVYTLLYIVENIWPKLGGVKRDAELVQPLMIDDQSENVNMERTDKNLVHSEKGEKGIWCEGAWGKAK